MKHLNLVGVGSISALIALGFLSFTPIANLPENSVAEGNQASASIAIHRSEIVDTETGSIVYVSSLKRN